VWIRCCISGACSSPFTLCSGFHAGCYSTGSGRRYELGEMTPFPKPNGSARTSLRSKKQASIIGVEISAEDHCPSTRIYPPHRFSWAPSNVYSIISPYWQIERLPGHRTDDNGAPAPYSGLWISRATLSTPRFVSIDPLPHQQVRNVTQHRVSRPVANTTYILCNARPTHLFRIYPCSTSSLVLRKDSRLLTERMGNECPKGRLCM
jgi:hypothetical protein